MARFEVGKGRAVTEAVTESERKKVPAGKQKSRRACCFLLKVRGGGGWWVVVGAVPMMIS